MKKLQDFPSQVWFSASQSLPANSVLRLQHKESLYVNLVDGKVDTLDREVLSGMGLQTFSAEGKSVLVSEDSLNPEICKTLVHEALTLLENTEKYLEDPSRALESLEPLRTQIERPALNLNEKSLIAFAQEMHSSLIHEDIKVNTSVEEIEEVWRILRKDGSDVWFNVPRISLHHSFTYHGENGKTISWSEPVCGDHRDAIRSRHSLPFILRNRDRLKDLLRSEPCRQKFDFLLIDAGLAKGLAHEAFGHSSESDLVREGSVLSMDRKYRTGIQVAPPFVHIIDKSVEGDWAYAPLSANGEIRNEVYLVKNGTLQHALADLHTANAIQAEAQGSARVESFAHPPLPRMSNIHFKLEQTRPGLKDPEDPEEVRKSLLESGWITEKDRVLQLMGYRGGQVNTLIGEYVFQCQGMYYHTQEGSTLHRGGQWSGEVLKTLKNIVGGFGDLTIFRQGTCGKSGQGVPSSGGGPQLLLFQVGTGFRVSSR
ncbi:MAG: metallopeptidase TldD-related protein [Planctomycetota bacterium]